MKAKKITFMALGIALYVVLGLIIQIPLLAGTHLQTDLGYIAYGAYLYMFGYPAIIVGVAGCMLESILTSGFVPVGWMLGQIAVGIIWVAALKRTNNSSSHLLRRPCGIHRRGRSKDDYRERIIRDTADREISEEYGRSARRYGPDGSRPIHREEDESEVIECRTAEE